VRYGQFDFYVCAGLEDRLGNVTLANGSESHSCGNTDPGPAQTLPPFTSSTWRVYCLVGFWGSVTYDIVDQGVNDGQLELRYSAFDGTYTCAVTNSALVFKGPGGSTLPENGNASGENWHYLFFVQVP
jgi:hypothetical protein